MAAPDPILPERRYGVPGVIVAGCAILVFVLAVEPLRVTSAARDALAASHARVRETLAAKDGPVSEARVRAAQAERQRLAGEVERLATFFRTRDAALEEFFPGYSGDRGMPKGAEWKRLYDTAAAALREEARAVAARDGNDQPIEPFAVHTWEVPPSGVEIELAQKEFWLQREVLTAAKAFKDVRLVAVQVASLPDEMAKGVAGALPALGDADGAGWAFLAVEVRAEMPAARAAAWCTAFGKTADRDLPAHIVAVRLEATRGVREFVEQTVDDQGQPVDKVDVEAMEPPIRVTLRLLVCDPPTPRKASA